MNRNDKIRAILGELVNIWEDPDLAKTEIDTAFIALKPLMLDKSVTKELQDQVKQLRDVILKLAILTGINKREYWDCDMLYNEIAKRIGLTTPKGEKHGSSLIKAGGKKT